MEIASGTTKIEVKLLASGRYVWSITSVFPTEQTDKVREIKKFDRLLQDEFPDYARRGSGRVAAIDEE